MDAPAAPDSKALVPPPLATRTTWWRPELTRWRMGLALGVAIAADGLQLLLGPIGWALSDEAIDVVAMVLTSGLLGFHVLLLPTFIVEFIPVVGMLPTWTGCVVAVIALRRRAARLRDHPGN
jgi:hypothetical protein